MVKGDVALSFRHSTRNDSRQAVLTVRTSDRHTEVVLSAEQFTKLLANVYLDSVDVEVAYMYEGS